MNGADAPAGPTLSKGEIRLVVIGVLLATFVAQMSQSIVAPALPTMASDLGSPRDGAAIIAAYLVAGTAATPIFGKLCDSWGRRPSLALALGFYIAGAVACALAPSMPWMIAARAVQGVGGGALIALTLVIVADVVAPKERGRYQPYLTSTFLAGTLAGPMLGGFFVDDFHWRAIFWLCAPLGVLALVVAEVTLRRRALPGNRRRLISSALRSWSRRQSR